MAHHERVLHAVEPLLPTSLSKETPSHEFPSDGPGVSITRVGSSGRRILDGAALASIQPLADSMPFFVTLVDVRHRILLANAAMTRAMGTVASEPIGAYGSKALHDLDVPLPDCAFGEALTNGSVVEREIQDPVTGRWMFSGIFPTPYCTANGEPVFLHSMRDITDAKQVNLGLVRKAQTHAALATLLHLSATDSSLDVLLQRALEEILDIPWLSLEKKGAIFLMDDDGQALRMRTQHGLNPAVRQACSRVPLGWCLCGRVAATGKMQYAADLDERHEVHYAGMEPHGHFCVPIRSEETVCGVLNLYLRVGHPEDVEEVTFLQAVADGLGGIVQRKLAEGRCSASREQLIQAEGMATIGTLAAGVVHEIKNPLAYVIANVDYAASELGRLLAIDGDSDDTITDPRVRSRLAELHSALGDAIAGAERIRGIVRDMRTFSNMHSDNSALLDVNQVVESAINIAFVEIGPRARFTKNLGRLPAVPGVDGRLGQVFLNLLINAAQAIPAGHAGENLISVRTWSESGEVAV